MAGKDKTYIPQHEIEALYKSGLSIRAVAKKYGVDGTTILYRMRRHGIKRRGRLETQKGRFGPDAQNWKGGRRIGPRGYWIVYNPSHPFAQGRYVLEHRLIMEKKLGRYLTPQETVHHKNGIRTDNRPSNLKLFATRGQHMSHHMRKK